MGSGVEARKGRSDGLVALLFLIPLLFFYGLYYLYAFGFLAQVSRQRVSLTFVNAVNVGWDNFRLVATDPLFRRSVLNTLLFAGISICAALTVGFLLAMMISTGVRGRKLLYGIFLLPSLIPLSLFATVFGQMLETKDGAFNSLFRAVGLPGLQQDWLGNTGSGYAAVAILLVYLIGLPIMYYTSDVTSINLSLIESATIDGAGTWQIFRLMLFPLLRNTHKTVILSVLLGSFRAFDVIFFSTGGQPGGRTSITGTYIYNAALGNDRVGYAAAASLIVLVIALLISFGQLLLTRKDR
ncbi:MAG: raffinose/stachyose/melibiose transport system permease protein [Pseudonocardiales bacterium]|jgi:ABC-type sugar transport system permease subunit|nr:raffinose/stachyose/melibiose transport system permease protein [Pseudonocardiales bacterium]